jgi:co-chaperonin GroES (HSP10)
LGERQRLSVKIDSRSCSTTSGIVTLESQTEGMEISKVSQVSAVLTRSTTEQVEEIQLDMLETGEIVLPDLNAQDIIELFVVYEGPYTEFDYRVS